MKENIVKKTLITIVAVIMLMSIMAGMLVGCTNDQTDDDHDHDDDTPTYVGPDWNEDAEDYINPIDDNYRVFYQIFVGSFSDSNGDGIGDLRGIINRIDYLNDGKLNSGKSLGVQGIWLSPIFTSPTYHKYDTTNYFQIDPKFGTEDDLIELLELCHERNVKVILDLVLNHTSINHPWFQQFSQAHLLGDTSSKYFDYYTYTTQGNFPAGRSFRNIPGCQYEYYECNFDGNMPELNYDNDDVKQEMLDIAKHYLDIGIDGFRFDAVKYIYYNDTENSVKFWKWYMEELEKYKEDIYCVGECWDGDTTTLSYIEALNCFNFTSAQGEGMIATAAKNTSLVGYVNYVDAYQEQVKLANPNGMPISFIANHDMDRAAGFLPLSVGRGFMAANLLLLSPGSPFIYYGEEIGLKGSRGGSNTDANRRLAMLWGDGDTVEDPEGATFDISKQINGTVADHIAKDDSLMHRYTWLISIRNEYPEIARGDYTAISNADINKSFAGFSVTYGNSTIGIFHNTSTAEITINLSDFGIDFTMICEYIGNGSATLNGNILTISAQSSIIMR